MGEVRGFAGALGGEIGDEQGGVAAVVVVFVDARGDVVSVEDVERFLVEFHVLHQLPRCVAEREIGEGSAHGDVFFARKTVENPGLSQEDNRQDASAFGRQQIGHEW